MPDNAQPFILSKHLPIGSMVVDAAMVLALVFSQGQISQTLKDIDSRVARLEQQQGQPDRATDARMNAIDALNSRQDNDAKILKDDVVARLTRIENKLDRIR